MSILELARHFTNRTQAGDVAGAKACLHPDCMIWQNYDNIAKTPDQIMATLELMKTKCKDYRYEVHHLEEIKDGYIQRHTLHLTSQSGEIASAEVIIMAKVEDGKITYAEEFLDPSALIKLLR